MIIFHGSSSHGANGVSVLYPVDCPFVPSVGETAIARSAAAVGCCPPLPLSLGGVSACCSGFNSPTKTPKRGKRNPNATKNQKPTQPLTRVANSGFWFVVAGSYSPFLGVFSGSSRRPSCPVGCLHATVFSYAARLL